ncbi:tryptophan 7-halogenase [Alteromonas sediminis]|uniref:Tryptophan 7-halogenase n=1 Tax=Alteromonas sediminis TaxID=2259342 RepID=A0A3N5YP58_9ALTE|nr:tryptophan halogenase family protein [Alteromonas sediminis]RPJ67581.1 tryptophan 7-halogenase [Alteromonas sediminis]
MNDTIKKVVVVGGGTAGWLSAALLKKVLGQTVELELVESESIGTVGVGEATIPPIRMLNNVLGLNEADVIRETKATIKLAIKFENWRVKGEGYFHTFGSPGRSYAFCHFHHFLNRARQQLGESSSIWDYDLNYLSAIEGRFAKMDVTDPILDMPFAYHFDASLYAKFLRKVAEQAGAVRTEGTIVDVTQHPGSGYIQGVRLANGREVTGDLFIDCSGFRGLLIQQQLNTGYIDWSHWLPCDRAIAIPSERHEHTLPYTRSIAHTAGWQWRIPLQHRNGNGHVYCSNYMSDDEALAVLKNNLDTAPLADPNFIKFKTGRRRKQWNKNVIAIGLSSGFLEPLESTSIHLIQSAIVRLLHLFPHQGINDSIMSEYNAQSALEFEQIRDFIILHYHVNERDDSQFWRDVRNMDVPERLRHKIDLFRQNGRLFNEHNDLFLDASWLQVMQGQGITPQDYHPMAKSIPQDKLIDMLKTIRKIKQDPVAQLPTHDEFLAKVCGN